MTEDELIYALAMDVPAMYQGFSIETSYGEMRFKGEDAERVAMLVEVLIRRRLEALRSGDNT